MSLHHTFKNIAWFIILCCCLSCNKDKLDLKPLQSQVVPTTLQDFQALLNNDSKLNQNYPFMGEVGSDNLYYSYTTWSAFSSFTERNTYIWTPDIYQGEIGSDWNSQYEKVFYCNVVLDGLEKIQLTDFNRQEWNHIKAQALFHRAFAFYQLLEHFAKPFGPNADAEPGIVLRLNSNLNEQSMRSTVKQCYEKIIADLLYSKEALPSSPAYKTRPSKPGAFALLAKVFLTMEDYAAALLYADSCLQINNSLIDYNTLSAASATPIPRFNTEVIFHATLTNTASLLPSRAKVDSTLYNSYLSDDLRKTIYFTPSAFGGYAFKGNYNNNANPLFGGIATDEIYLIRAECLARKGDITPSMNDLNTLLQKRWRNGFFIPESAATPQEALAKVLTERRKELLFRGLRWTDLRRLNKDNNLAVTLTRILDIQTYTLPPNDDRYVLPIPDNVILHSGIQQNPR